MIRCSATLIFYLFWKFVQIDHSSFIDFYQFTTSVKPDQILICDTSVSIFTCARSWFGLLLYIPVNSYGHFGTVSSPNHRFFLGKLYQAVNQYFVDILSLVIGNNYPWISERAELYDSSLRCHGLVCSLWLWYFLIILAYYLGTIYSHVRIWYYFFTCFEGFVPISYTCEGLVPILHSLRIYHAWLFTFVIIKSKFAVNCHHFIYFHK